MLFYSILVAAVGAGFVAGLGRSKLRMAPYIATGVVLAVCLGLVAYSGIWAAQCWDCFEGTESRGFQFKLIAFWYTLVATATIAAVWAGAGLSALISRVVRGTQVHGPVRR